MDISDNVDNRLRGLSLFSGIGGIDVGLSQWVRTVAYCENDVYCQRVLCSRMADGALDRAPVWDDVRTLRHQNLPEPVDIIFGGFPCQDISSAGRGAGLAGGRSGLYWELWRLVAQHRPPFVFLENVPAIRTRGLDVVASSLSGLGYDLRWTTLAASDVGAPHRRQRWFCLAFSGKSYSKFLRSQPRGQADVADAYQLGLEKPRDLWSWESLTALGGQDVAHAKSIGLNTRSLEESEEQSTAMRSSWWETEPRLDRVVNELPERVDRVRCLGNAVVPAQVQAVYWFLLTGDYSHLMGIGSTPVIDGSAVET